MFRHACSLKPVNQWQRGCAHVQEFVCMCVVYSSILFICDRCSGKEAVWILVVSASRQQEPFVYSHLFHRDTWGRNIRKFPQTPVHFPTNVPWKLFLGGTLLPIHFLFGSSQIAFHFDKLWGVFLLLFILILLQFQLNKKNFSQFLHMPLKHPCLCVRGNIPVQGFLVSSWARSQGLIFSCVPPAPLSEPSAPGLSSSSPSLSGVLVYSVAQGPCDKKKEELVQLHTYLLSIHDLFRCLLQSKSMGLFVHFIISHQKNVWLLRKVSEHLSSNSCIIWAQMEHFEILNLVLPLPFHDFDQSLI